MLSRDEIERVFAPLLLEYVMAAMNLQYAQSSIIHPTVNGHAEKVQKDIQMADERINAATKALFDKIAEVSGAQSL